MRHSRIVNESIRLKLARQSDGVIVEASFFGISHHPVRQNTEFQLAAVVEAAPLRAVRVKGEG